MVAVCGVIGERAPQATLVFDRFHIMANLLHALDEVRRAEHMNCTARRQRVRS